MSSVHAPSELALRQGASSLAAGFPVPFESPEAVWLTGIASKSAHADAATAQRTEREQLRALAWQLTQAEERVRREVASVLHDQVGQLLTVCELKLAQLEAGARADQAPAMLDVRALIRKVLEQTRSLTTELAPPILYEFGLAAAIRSLAAQMLEPMAIAVEFDIRNMGTVDSGRRMIVFSAVRELFLNILKHANATHVVVRAWATVDRLHVEVDDNGVGAAGTASLSAGKSGVSFGLHSIRERLQNLGGTFELNLKASGSARACLSIPLPAGNHEQA